MYQDSILNKIISYGYNDAWFLNLRFKSHKIYIIIYIGIKILRCYSLCKIG